MERKQKIAKRTKSHKTEQKVMKRNKSSETDIAIWQQKQKVMNQNQK